MQKTHKIKSRYPGYVSRSAAKFFSTLQFTALPSLRRVQKILRTIPGAPRRIALLGTALLFCLASSALLAQNDDEFFIEIGNNTVVAEDGDTLQSIAIREYGSPAFWRLIAEYNNFDAGSSITTGQQIKLPVLSKRRFEFAQIAFAKGTVLLKRNDEEDSPLASGDRIGLTDSVVTGKDGFASLAFRTGSIVNVQPQSEVQLVRLRCLETDKSCVLGIRTTRGEVSSNVQRIGDQPTDFRIVTPYATAAVRGTQFDFQADPASLLVGVTEGNVDVVTQGTASNLDTGFGSITLAGEAPSDPIELIAPPTFKGIPARVAGGDKISWWRTPDSEQYIVSISSDPSASEVLTSTRQPDQVFQIADIDPGPYYINVRSVDSNGLKGFGTSQKLNVVGIDSAGGEFAMAADREGSNLLLSVTELADTASGYEVQVSENNEFEDVVSLDIGQSGQLVLRSPDGALYARVRALYGTDRVSPFGPALQVN